MVFEIGRLCIKTAGRDANNYCVIIDVIDDNYVLVDGATRRRKINIKHLKPTDKVINIQKEAPHELVKEELKKLNIIVKDQQSKEPKPKPKKTRKHKVKKEEKKESKKTNKELKEKKELNKDSLTKEEEKSKSKNNEQAKKKIKNN